MKQKEWLTLLLFFGVILSILVYTYWSDLQVDEIFKILPKNGGRGNVE